MGGAGSSCTPQRYAPDESNSVSLRHVSSREDNSEYRSVRAMALKNHSRQSNSYISQDEISSRLIIRVKSVSSDSYHKPVDAPEEPPRDITTISKSTTEDGVSTQQDDTASDIKTIVSENSDKVLADNPIPVVPLNSFAAFKKSFDLTINLGNDHGLAQVLSDEEEESDQPKPIFHRHLLQLPSIETRDSPPRDSMQYKSDGTIVVDGLQAGVSEEGIIRPDRSGHLSSSKRLLLPMRDRLVVLCKLGAGASSAVYKALDLTDMRLVAVKMIHVHEREKRDQFVSELRLMFQHIKENSRRSSIHIPKKYRRPEKYIVDFYDAFSNKEDGIVSLMLEYMDGGSLQDIVDHGGCSDETTLANISVQALKGLQFMHENKQIHRDIKPANFLISHRGEVKVSDLGIAKQLNEATMFKAKSFVGTTNYMAPEKIDGKEYSFPSDVWSFGLSIMTVALGRLPIESHGSYWSVLHSIRDAPPPSLPDSFSKEFRDFIGQCLKRNPDDRVLVNHLLQHQFLKKTVVEDLASNQNYDRGKQELISILDAVHTHVKALLRDAKGRDPDQSADSRGDLRPVYDRLFGDLLHCHSVDVMRNLFFPAPDTEHSKRVVRPRLNNLGKQLHLPMDRVELEARQYIEGLQRDQ